MENISKLFWNNLYKYKINILYVPPFYDISVRKLTQIFGVINFLLIHTFAYFAIYGSSQIFGINSRGNISSRPAPYRVYSVQGRVLAIRIGNAY